MALRLLTNRLVIWQRMTSSPGRSGMTRPVVRHATGQQHGIRFRGAIRREECDTDHIREHDMADEGKQMNGSISPRELLHIQLTLQCIGVEAGNLLVRISGSDPDGIPRYYVARFSDDTYDVFVARDVPPALRKRLTGLPPFTAFENPARVETLLASSAPCEGIWMGTSYTFSDAPAPTDYPDTVRLNAEEHAELARAYDPELSLDGRAAFAIVREGRIIASCVSSRENVTAGEAWVRTDDAYRGRGYARQVTAAWGSALRQVGKIAFYSHRTDNAASAGVARSLGLRRFVSDVGFL